MQRAPPSERVAILFLSVMLAVGRLEAQAPTGKIDGGVRSPDGSPLVEAQVYIVGTTYSALTDPRGHYFINNIPAGTIAMRVALIGHRPVELRNLRVLAGQTITQDFVLEPAPVQLQELITVIAENLLVPRDEVTSKQRVNGEFADELPVDRLRGRTRPAAGGRGRRGRRRPRQPATINPWRPPGRGGHLYRWSTGNSRVSVGGLWRSSRYRDQRREQRRGRGLTDDRGRIGRVRQCTVRGRLHSDPDRRSAGRISRLRDG